jgi:hypothetical protein
VMTSGRSKETCAGMVLEDQATLSERAFLENHHRPRNKGAECERLLRDSRCSC